MSDAPKSKMKRERNDADADAEAERARVNDSAAAFQQQCAVTRAHVDFELPDQIDASEMLYTHTISDPPAANVPIKQQLTPLLPPPPLQKTKQPTGTLASAQAATNEQMVARVREKMGAALVLGKNSSTVTLRPMPQLFDQQLAAAAIARRKQEETNGLAAAGAEVAKQAFDGKRAARPEKTSAENKTATASLPWKLAANDPAANVVDRLDIITAMCLPFLESAVRYHEAKSKLLCIGSIDNASAAAALPSSKTTPLPPPDPELMLPDHVDFLHTKAYPPFQACMFGAMCQGTNPLNVHSLSITPFPFIQYVPPAVRAYYERTHELPKSGTSMIDYMDLDESGRPIPTPCLRCLNSILLFMSALNVGEDRPDRKVPFPYRVLVGVLGGYDPSAIFDHSDGRINGIVHPVRNFSHEQFEPCTRDVLVVTRMSDDRIVAKREPVQGYRERDIVKFFGVDRGSNQRRALEGDPRAIGPSSVPPLPPGPQCQPRVPATYPMTDVAGGPLSATKVLRSALQMPLAPPISLAADTNTVKTPSASAAAAASSSSAKPSEPPELDEWALILQSTQRQSDAYRRRAEQQQQRLVQQQRALEQQQKNGLKAHRLFQTTPASKMMRGGDDAPSSVSVATQQLLLDKVPLPSKLSDALLELTFRDLGEAYRLAFLWLRSGKRTPEQLGLVRTSSSISKMLFPSARPLGDVLDTTDYTNLLCYLVALRVEVCLELEEHFFQGVGARRPWVFSRALAPPTGSESAGAANAEEAGLSYDMANVLFQKSSSASSSGGTPGKRRRKKILEPLMISAVTEPRLQQRFASMIEEMKPGVREQTGTQIVYWRNRHAPVLAHLLKQHTAASSSLITPEFQIALLTDPLVRGLAPQMFEKLFELPEISASLPPLYDKDIERVQLKTQLRQRETPVEYLRLQRLPDHPRKLLLETVLVDFRETIQFLVETPPFEVSLRIDQWMPVATEETDTEFIRSRAFETDRKAWVQKMCEHICKKDPGNRQRAAELEKECQERTDRIARVLLATYRTDSATTERLKARDTLFERVLVQRRWRADAMGRNASTNYLILVAVVYRVNHALYEYEEERRQLELLQQQFRDAEASGQGSSTSSSSSAATPLAGVAFASEDQLRDITETVRNLMNSQQPKTERGMLLRDKISQALMSMHCWKRFAYSHLALAQLMLDAPRCDDDFLLCQTDERSLSHYTLAYPFIETAWGEEMLQNIRHRVRIVDVIHGLGGGGATGTLPARTSNAAAAAASASASGNEADRVGKKKQTARQQQHHQNQHAASVTMDNTGVSLDDPDASMSHDLAKDNPYISLLKKIFPKACSDRDFSSRCDELCRTNVRCFEFVLESFFAMLGGWYRHAYNPPRFANVISLYRIYEQCRGSEEHRSLMLDVFFSNEELVSNFLISRLLFLLRHILCHSLALLYELLDGIVHLHGVAYIATRNNIACLVAIVVIHTVDTG
jgi:hypothetical protein